MAFNRDEFLASRGVAPADSGGAEAEAAPSFDRDAFLKQVPKTAAAPPSRKIMPVPKGAPPGRFPSVEQQQKLGAYTSPEERVADLMGGMNTAIMDVVDLPSTVWNLGASVVGADKFKVAPTMSALRPYVADRTEAMKNANNPVQDFMRTFTEWGAGGGSAVSRMADKGSDLLMAGGAAVGEAAGGDVGEIVGGVTGALTPAAWGKVFGKDSVPEQLIDSANFLRENITDAEFASVVEGVRTGDVGSLQDLAKNYENLPEIENAIRRMTPRNKDAFDEVYSAREQRIGQQFEDTVTPAGSNTAVPQQELARQLRGANSAIDQGQTAAVGRAGQVRGNTVTEAQAAEQAAAERLQQSRVLESEADTALGGRARTDEASTELAGAYRKLDNDLREELVSPPWARFDEIREIETKKLQGDLSDFSESMPKDMRADLNSQYKTIMNKLNNMENIADPRDIQYVLSTIKQINRNARATSDFGPLNKQLGEVQNILDGAMAKDVRVGPAFQDAIAATIQQKTRLGGKKGGKALALALDSPETFVDSFGGFAGNTGADTVRRIKASESPEVMDKAAEALRSELRRTSMKEDVLTRYEAALDAFPEVGDDVRRAISSRMTLDDAAKEAGTAQKATLATEKQADTVLNKAIARLKSRSNARKTTVKGLDVAKFADRPNSYIDSMLKDDDYSGQLGKLYQRISRQGDEYGEAFKSKVIGRLKEDILAADKLDGKLGAKLNKLMDDGIITDANRQQVVDIIAMQEGRRLRRSAGASNREVAGQGQAQQLVDELLTTGGVITVLQGLPSSHQLMAAGMLKRTIGRYLRNKRLDPERIGKLRDLLTNPEKFVNVIEGRLTPDMPPEAMGEVFKRSLIKLGVFSGQTGDIDEED